MGYLDTLFALIAWDLIRDNIHHGGKTTTSLPSVDDAIDLANRRNAVMCWHCPDRVWWDMYSLQWTHVSTGTPAAETPNDGYGPYPPHVAVPDANYPGFFPPKAEDRIIRARYRKARRT